MKPEELMYNNMVITVDNTVLYSCSLLRVEIMDSHAHTKKLNM